MVEVNGCIVNGCIFKVYFFSKVYGVVLKWL